MYEIGEAHSLADLIEAAHSVEARMERSQAWFRGHADSNWGLTPSAFRKDAILESQFANLFRLSAPSIAPNCPEHTDYVGWLPLMQHYGLPTRLLDWTESLLVASFFAVMDENQDSAQAAIWMLNPGKLNQIVARTPYIPFLTDNYVAPSVKAAFTTSNNDSDRHAISVLAPRTDRRMAAQLGNYTIHDQRIPLETHPDSGEFLARVLIPESAYNKIRSDLSVAGIKRSSLFPDLSTLAKEISNLQVF
ncbi:FRG domain-containing protein [Uliginosibacterium flavum]|uniref:FRG domain-containing protein n=1 Tax=Uliginosibacterium flavum TaxID=1396831 RepID=A0ABV2TJH7_9RHOO